MASFEIDERKLRDALPPADGEWYDGFKWGGAILGIVVLFIGSLVLLGLGIARALL